MPTANKHYKNFMKRLKRQQPDLELKYATVIEFHQRGAIHYHMICNLGYMRKDVLQKCWGMGRVDIRRLYQVDNVGAYVVKNMTKDGADTRLCGKKAYQTSQHLIKPQELVGAQAE